MGLQANVTLAWRLKTALELDNDCFLSFGHWGLNWVLANKKVSMFFFIVIIIVFCQFIDADLVWINLFSREKQFPGWILELTVVSWLTFTLNVCHGHVSVYCCVNQDCVTFVHEQICSFWKTRSSTSMFPCLLPGKTRSPISTKLPEQEQAILPFILMFVFLKAACTQTCFNQIKSRTF